MKRRVEHARSRIQQRQYRSLASSTGCPRSDSQEAPVAGTIACAEGSSHHGKLAAAGDSKGLDPDTTEGPIDLASMRCTEHACRYLRVTEPAAIRTALWRQPSTAARHNVFVVESFMAEPGERRQARPPRISRMALSTKARAKAVLCPCERKKSRTWGRQLPRESARPLQSNSPRQKTIWRMVRPRLEVARRTERLVCGDSRMRSMRHAPSTQSRYRAARRPGRGHLRHHGGASMADITLRTRQGRTAGISTLTSC